MAKEPTKEKEKKDETAGGGKHAGSKNDAGFSMKKMIMVVIPIFIVQVVVVYFLVAKFLVPMTASQQAVAHVPVQEKIVQEKDQKYNKVFVVSDIIINPAGTQGTRFLLTTIGMEVSTPAAYTELEMKELQLRDVLNSILTSKRLDELVNVNLRDELREEIMADVNRMINRGELEHVYFSKFIIQ